MKQQTELSSLFNLAEKHNVENMNAQIKMGILGIIISNPLSDTDNIQHKIIDIKGECEFKTYYSITYPILFDNSVLLI